MKKKDHWTGLVVMAVVCLLSIAFLLRDEGWADRQLLNAPATATEGGEALDNDSHLQTAANTAVSFSEPVSITQDPPLPAGTPSSGAQLVVICETQPWPVTMRPLPRFVIVPAGQPITSQSPSTPIGALPLSTIEDLGTGPHQWSLQIEEAVVYSGDLSLHEGNNRLELNLDTFPSLLGRVVDTAGQGIDHVQVITQPFERVQGNVAAVTAFTDVEGWFLFAVLPPDFIITLQFSREGYQPESRTIMLNRSDGDLLDGDIILRRDSPLRGLVRLDNGDPAENCPVRASVGSISRGAKTDAEGRFTIRELKAGTARVWTEDHRYINAEKVIENTPSAPPIEFILHAGAYVEGHVIHANGEPATGITLCGEPAAPPDNTPSAIGMRRTCPVTDPSGAFRLGPLPSGRALLWERKRPGRQYAVPVESGVKIVLGDSAPFTTTVTLRDQASGEPLSTSGNYSLRWGKNSLRQIPFNTRRDGTFEIIRQMPPAESFDLIVVTPGYETGIEKSVTLQRSSSHSLTMSLSQLQPVAIKVEDEKGLPIAGADIRIAWPETADQLGEFRANVERARFEWYEDQPSMTMRHSADTGGTALFDATTTGPIRWIVQAPGCFPATGELANAWKDGPIVVVLRRPWPLP